MPVRDARFISSALLVRDARVTTISTMFRALGVVIILWYVSRLFAQSFSALDGAMTATFETLEATAIASREHIE